MTHDEDYSFMRAGTQEIPLVRDPAREAVRAGLTVCVAAVSEAASDDNVSLNLRAQRLGRYEGSTSVLAALLVALYGWPEEDAHARLLRFLRGAGPGPMEDSLLQALLEL